MTKVDKNSLDGLSSAEKKMLLARLLHDKARQQNCFALTVGQRGLWAMWQMDRASPVGNMPFCTRIRSPLDPARLRLASQELMDRHASLRTTFEEHDGQLVQRVHSRMEFPFEVVPAEGWSDEQIRELLERELHRPFDLEKGPLVRATLVSRDVDDHALLVVAHHIVIDYWSLVVLVQEVRRRLGDREAGHFGAPAASFRDFVDWQERLLAGEAGRRLVDYWDKELEGVPHVLDLPTDRPRPAVFSHRGAVAPVHFDLGFCQRLQQLAVKQQTTVFVVLLSAFQVLLKNYTRQTDFLVGSPYSGRSRSEFERLAGCCMNMLPLRARLKGDPTFGEVLRRTKRAAVGALEHQDCPFPLIVDRLRVQRDASRSPLVQACFALQRAHLSVDAEQAPVMFSAAPSSKGDGLLGETFYVEQRSSQFDLELILEQDAGEIRGTLRYCPELIEAATAQRMVGHYLELLNSGATNPEATISRMDWLTESERRQVVSQWNQTEASFSGDFRLHSMFEQQARRTPQAIAASQAGRQWTYGEVEREAGRLAGQLRRLALRRRRELQADQVSAAGEAHEGIREQPLVALWFWRCPEMLVAILGVLKSGAAYVPLDPEAPIHRTMAILADTRASTVVTLKRHAAEIPGSNLQVVCVDAMDVVDAMDDDVASHGDASHPQPPSPDDLAYVVYTSGSTGVPKGVMVEHRSICNTIYWRQTAIPFRDDDRALLILPYYFDASIGLVFQTLSHGARLVMPQVGEEFDAAALSALACSESITVCANPPRVWEMLLPQPEFGKCRSLRLAFTGGEIMASDLPSRIEAAFGIPIHNFYGPTEAAVEATWSICQGNDPAATSRIGRPVSNTRAYILDENGHPLPIGVPGELHLAGAGLARGYLGDSELTSERFVTRPLLNPELSDQRLYRSGDLCRWRNGGEIEFLGRIDDQVKFRGYRIELGELDHALSRHPEIAEAASAVVQRPGGESELASYIVPRAGRAAPTFSAVNEFLRQRLPLYMLPSSIVAMTELPRTPSGKLDRLRLPAPSQDALREATPFVPPRTELETFLAEQWKQVLHCQQVGVLDNFYELGGNSIQGAMVVSRLQDALGVNVHLSAVFHLPDVASLATYLADSFPDAVAATFGQESLASASSGAGSLIAASRADDAPPPVGVDLLVPLQRHGSQAPLFLVHPPGGIVVCYQQLAQQMGRQRPVYGIRARGLHGESNLPATLPDAAAEYVAAIRYLQPQGPYLLAGWSLGGVIAFEMAQQLRRAEQAVGLLALLDTTIPFGDANQKYNQDGDNDGDEYGLDLTFAQLAELAPRDQLPYLWEHARKLGVVDDSAPPELVQQVLNDLQHLFHSHVSLANQYALEPYDGEIAMFRPVDAPVRRLTADDRGWRQLADSVEVIWVPGLHHTMVQEPYVQALARELRKRLDF